MPGSVGFSPEAAADLRDAQLILAGMRPEDIDDIDESMADLILSVSAIDRQAERLFLAQVHGAKVRGQ